MLDLMRRKSRLKIVLWFVLFSLALGMLLFFVPGGDMGGVAIDSSAATVDGHEISMKEAGDTYQRFLKNFGDRVDAETIKSMGLPKQVLSGLIRDKVIEIIADRLGVTITDAELQKTIENFSPFQDKGKFVGLEEYKAILNSRGFSIVEFEKDMRLRALSQKVQYIIADSIAISDIDLRNEFSRTKQETQVSYVLLKKDDFKKRVKASEQDLQAYFEGHKDAYKIKERRQIQYLLVPTAQFFPSITVSDQEIEQEWNLMPHEETVTAAHILIKPDDPSKAPEALNTAKQILKMAKSGKPFADLAKSYSRDANSAGAGGVIEPFTRGSGVMPKGFEDAAFSLQPNEISDVVQTELGYHIIKLLKRDKPTLESNRSNIVTTIQRNKARDLAKKKAEEAAAAAQKQKDLNLAGKNLGAATDLKLSAFFSREDNPYNFDISPDLQNEAFELKAKGAIGKVVEHPQGYAVPQLMEVQMPRPSEFSEARTQVEKDYIDSKVQELLQAEANKLSYEAGKQGSLEKIAKAMNLSAKTTQPFKIDGTPDPEIASIPAFNSAAFSLDIGSTSAPIAVMDNIAVLQVKSRTPFDEAGFQKEKTALREKVLEARQEPYFQEYLDKIMGELEKARKININSKALDQMTSMTR
jgi:peptidyl-prolyl cis-trans isomerase D